MAKGTCKIVEDGEPCDRNLYAKGLCEKHYDRVKDHGHPYRKSRRSDSHYPSDYEMVQVMVEQRSWEKCASVFGVTKESLRDFVSKRPVLKERMQSLVEIKGRAAHYRDPVRWFLSWVDPDGPIPDYAPHLGPCTIWLGKSQERGYGRIWGQNPARVAYEMFIGPMPIGMEPDHLCRVRLCVRPSHIEPVTSEVNNRRKPYQGGGRPQGTPGTSNGYREPGLPEVPEWSSVHS